MSESSPSFVTAAFAAIGHDHTDCVGTALARAEALCAQKGARLTELRKRVLELVWRSHEPVGAYQILQQLGSERGAAAPPTVYRALEFLLEQGLIHRIEALNAFVGCADPGRPHSTQFLICSRCGTAAELSDPQVDAVLTAAAVSQGFAIERRAVELMGVCPHCRAADHA